MTTTETDTPADEPTDQSPEAPQGGGPPAEPPVLTEGPSKPRNEALWTRAILPVALPLLAAVAMAVWVINLSRAFLAGSKTGAVVTVMIVTLTIMAGAAFMSAATRMKSSTRLLLLSAFLVLIISAGFVSLGPSEETEEVATGYQEPTGPAVATLSVVAGPGTRFDSTEYTVTPDGIIEVEYSGEAGHTLAFRDSQLVGFLLKSSPAEKGKVELAPGDYDIYCTIPGHAAAGMEAVVTVE